MWRFFTIDLIHYVLYIFCVTLAMTFDLRSKGHSISTPPKCARYRCDHFKAIGLAVFSWTRSNGKNTDYYGFTDQYMDFSRNPFMGCTAHTHGSTLKISKLYFQNWQSYSCECEVGGQKERKNNLSNNNRTPQTEFGGVLKNFCNNNRTPQIEFGGVLKRESKEYGGCKTKTWRSKQVLRFFHSINNSNGYLKHR